MKKQYTKKQIQEAIDYWKKQLRESAKTESGASHNKGMKEYEQALKRECQKLKKQFTHKQLNFASWLYVYAFDCEDKIAKQKYPACKAMLEAMDRLYEISERLGLEAEIDNDVYTELNIGDGEKKTLEQLGL